MYEVTMPKLSDSMTAGKIIEWKVKEGQPVREGQTIAEVESDKAAMELECFHSGILSKIVKGDGAEVAVGEVIAYIAADGEAAAEPNEDLAKVRANPRKVRSQAEPTPTAAQAPSPKSAAAKAAARIPISPYARKLLEESGIDLGTIKGSGPGGRVIAADVESAVVGAKHALPLRGEGAPTPTPRRPSPDDDLPPIEVAPGEADVEEASFRMKTQARLVTASKRTIPHFYVTRSVEMHGIVARKEGLKARYGATITHVIMFACLKALAAHPEVNRSYDRGRIIKWKGINLGLAVETDQGLTVVVIPNAQRLGLKELADSVRALVERARADKLTAEDRRHPTFTISNLGMFDVEQFEPIIAPPSAITLAVSSILPTPVVRDGKLEAREVMKLTISCDHRVIDGVQAAKFLRDLGAALEDADGLLTTTD